MAAITPQLVNDLRAKTGLGMMECKKLLSETGGDITKAIEEARKKGVKTSITDRAATEGRVEVLTSGSTAVAVEITCNTDFAAKSEQVAKIASLVAQKIVGNPAADVAGDASIKDALVSAAQVTGENIQVGRTKSLTGNVGSYLYSTAGKGKIGVLVQFDKPANEELVKLLGMHIAAARPVALSRDQVPAEIIAKEKEIAIEQAKATGKPQNIAEKIAEGKMGSFYAERVLLDQEFINAEAFKGTVAALLKSKGVTLTQYVRLEVGQA